jgi:hypothetical protein
MRKKIILNIYYQMVHQLTVLYMMIQIIKKKEKRIKIEIIIIKMPMDV